MKERLRLIKQIIKEELNKEVFVYDDVMRSVFDDNRKILIKFLNKQNYERIEIPSSLSIFDNELTKLPDNMNIRGSLTLMTRNLTELPKNLTVSYGNIDARDTKILELPEDTKISGGRFYPSTELSIKKRKNNNEWDVNNVTKGSIGERANALYKFIKENFDETEFKNINEFEVYDIIPEIIKHGSMYRFEIPELDNSVWVVGTYSETEATAIEQKSDELEHNLDSLDLDEVSPYLNKRRMLDDAFEYIKDNVNEDPESWGLDSDNDLDEDGEWDRDKLSNQIDFFYGEAKGDIIKFYTENGMDNIISDYLDVKSYVSDIIENEGFGIIEQFYDDIGEVRINLNVYYVARID
jgi:hypothetical protein